MKKVEAERRPRITRDTLLSLETYARTRNEYRAKVIAHKKDRTVHLGDHVMLIFEDELTIRYQVQEMLRAERIFEAEGIEEELVLDGRLHGPHLHATALLQLAPPSGRLGGPAGVSARVWIVAAVGRPRFLYTSQPCKGA